MELNEAVGRLTRIRDRLECYIAVDPDAMPNLTARWICDRDAIVRVLEELKRLSGE